MLLRRVIKHVKTQNWTAVCIDFVIVVVGVFIGLQVQEWSVERGDRERMATQLSSFREELIFARNEMRELRTYIEVRIDDATSLRERLADPDADVTDSEIYALSFSAVRMTPLDFQFPGFRELSTTGAISKIDDPVLREQIYQWDASLSNLRSDESNAAEFRNIVSLRPILDALSFGNMARSDSRYGDMTAATRFAIDIDAVRNDRDFDNALVARIVIESQKLNSLLALERATDDLIAALGDPQ